MDLQQFERLVASGYIMSTACRSGYLNRKMTAAPTAEVISYLDHGVHDIAHQEQIGQLNKHGNWKSPGTCCLAVGLDPSR